MRVVFLMQSHGIQEFLFVTGVMSGAAARLARCHIIAECSPRFRQEPNHLALNGAAAAQSADGVKGIQSDRSSCRVSRWSGASDGWSRACHHTPK